MVDLLQRRGFTVSPSVLSEELKCNVVPIDGRSGNGVEELIKAAEQNLKKNRISGTVKPLPFDSNVDVEYLLDLYKEIEQIECKAVSKIIDNEKQVNLDDANKRLVLLNSELNRKINLLDQTSLKIDRIMLHKVWGIVLFFLAMAITFTSIFWLAQPVMNLVDKTFGFLSYEALNILGNNWYGNFIANGIISGTGSVMIFIPQIIILFLILGLLEDTGYLARGAMLIDKPLSKIGLNGRSFVPMLSGFACAIPAILAARTIPNKRERFLTIFIIPLMSCSARLPVYALLLAFLFLPIKNG